MSVRMKRSSALIYAAAFAAGAWTAFADPVVDNITVRQRWPWNGKVDIDYTLVAATNCDIAMQATYVGCTAPIVFTNGVVERTPIGVAPGANHIVWDPADSGLGGRTLADFTVTATSVDSVADRTYLVLDLTTGEYEYMASRPADELGWTNAVYKGQKMAFRRVPAGIYTVGHTEAEMKVVKSSPSADEKRSMGQRQVELTSDFYIGIFPVTTAHNAYLTGGSATQNYTVYRTSYEAIRGATNSDASVNINWPVTGIGKVADGTFLAKLRERTGGKLAIDLPTEIQWEVAMRAGSATIFPNGGTSESTQNELKALWTEFAPASTTEAVGLRSPNAWDIYNPLGMQYYWCLDAFPRTTSAAQEDNKWEGQAGIDPFGRTIADGAPLVRIARGGGYQNGASIGALPGFRRGYLSSTAGVAFRLCIHLNPIVK